MLGFPYNYGDELSEDESLENFKLFLKNYGPILCVNGIRILFSKSVYAADNPGAGPPSKPGGGELVPEPKPAPADAPVFALLVPLTNFVYSKPWRVCCYCMGLCYSG